MDIFSHFATDSSLEEKGVWKKIGNGRFLIARQNNRAYNKLFAELYDQNQQAISSNDEESNKLAEDLVAQVYAKTVLLGWDGDNTFKGESLGEYTPEKALELLRVKEFRKVISDHASKFENFRAQQEEAQGKP